jgi:hypothetical protein
MDVSIEFGCVRKRLGSFLSTPLLRPRIGWFNNHCMYSSGIARPIDDKNISGSSVMGILVVRSTLSL